jgi:hypothetical protein
MNLRLRLTAADKRRSVPPLATSSSSAPGGGKRLLHSRAARFQAARTRPFAGRVLRRLDARGFSFVMASGIVSVAAALQGLPLLSEALLGVACIGWVTLVLAPTVLQQASAQPQLESFAFVAATAVLGTRLSLLGQPVLALALWALAGAAWLALLARRPRGGRADGGWFLVVVGTESLAVLASSLAGHWNESSWTPRSDGGRSGFASIRPSRLRSPPSFAASRARATCKPWTCLLRHRAALLDACAARARRSGVSTSSERIIIVIRYK